MNKMPAFFFASILATACGGGDGSTDASPEASVTTTTTRMRPTVTATSTAEEHDDDTESEPPAACNVDKECGDALICEGHQCTAVSEPETEEEACRNGRIFDPETGACLPPTTSVEGDEDADEVSFGGTNAPVVEPEPEVTEPQPVVEPEPEVTEPEPPAAEPQPTPNSGGACSYSDADCNFGRVIGPACSCVADEGTCEDRGDLDTQGCSGNKERYCGMDYRWTDCREPSQPQPPVVEPEPSCTGGCEPEPPAAEPEPQPAPQPEPVVEPEVTEPEPPATEPEPQPAPQPEPVVEPDTCVSDCEERGAECGFSAAASALFCGEFCDALPEITESTKQCLLALECDTLIEMVDPEVAQEQVDACEGVEPEPAPQPEPVVEPESEPVSSIVSVTFKMIIDATSGELYIDAGSVNEAGEATSITATCASAEVKDPANDDELLSGVVCTQDLDASITLDGQGKAVTAAGEKWLAGWEEQEGNCQKFVRMYLYDDEENPIADYDNLSATDALFPYHMRSSAPESQPGTCHFFLDAGWNE